MKLIPLTQGLSSKVDDEDFDRLNELKWYVLKRKGGLYYYAQRGGGRNKTVMMHHVVIGRPAKGLIVDHIDGDGLNNQKENLRFVTYRQNRLNSIQSQKAKLYYKDGKNSWRVEVIIEGKATIKRFGSETAAKSYVESIKEGRQDEIW